MYESSNTAGELMFQMKLQDNRSRLQGLWVGLLNRKKPLSFQVQQGLGRHIRVGGDMAE
jgi:hypothetical protein